MAPRLRLVAGGLLIPAALLLALPIATHRDAEAVAADAPSKAKSEAAASAKVDFKGQVVPLLQKYCITCHNDKKETGGLSLEKFNEEAAALKARPIWEKVEQKLASREMPPKNRTQPSPAERDLVVNWVQTQLTNVNCGLAKDPGRPTIRRLNRAEYDNTIRDLVGGDFHAGEDFPSDDVGYGFDNIGDVLSMPPILMEKYLRAADKVLDGAIVVPRPIKADKRSYRPQNVISTLGRASRERDRVALTKNGAAIIQQDFDYEGEYLLRVRAYGDQAGDELPKLVVQVDRKDVKSFDVAAKSDKPQTYEVRTKIARGKHAIAAAFTNDFYDDETGEGRSLYIQLLEVDGPYNAIPPPLPESHKHIFVAMPKGEADKESTAKQILESFARRAYRRPVKSEEVARLVKLFKLADAQGEPFEAALKVPLKAVLVSPHFLFKIEVDREPSNATAVHSVNDFELATRLSYFLWASMPDEELFHLAEQGKLRQPGVLEAQVRRMLKSPKVKALTENFASQWLQLRTLQTAIPDRETYPAYGSTMRSYMLRETEMFFENIVQEDRSVLEFVDSDYTFLNGPLARFYGMSDVSGLDFRKVTLTDKNRGGVITQASVLTLTSNPTRTSPVKRGKWILENILGTPPPPPPPDVPDLPNEKHAAEAASLRQRMEEHRKNAVCASCHQRMDPLGFGLENFDGIGKWRTTDGKFKIDPAGELPDGASFAGPADLRKVLLGKADLFRRCLAEKMLTYALGRGLEYYDKCAVDELVKALQSHNDRFSALVIGVVNSEPFQKRRGQRSE
jgi:mono/diheme cytochrome c family protein